MTMIETTGAVEALAQRIDTIEEAYEFMLAYAAQGRRDERGAPEPGIRTFLNRIDTALVRIEEIAVAAAREGDAKVFGPVIEILAEDAARAQALVRFVLARPSIGSQLIDNLNASIHLRALLTDLFLVDEWLKGDAA